MGNNMITLVFPKWFRARNLPLPHSARHTRISTHLTKIHSADDIFYFILKWTYHVLPFALAQAANNQNALSVYIYKLNIYCLLFVTG